MKKRRKTVSEDRLTITQRNARPENERENSSPHIPVDQTIDICSRLQAKSVAACRCVSKLWASTLRLPHFNELFLTRSLARPQLLFAFQKHGRFCFFSSPQPQNPDENSSPIVANYHMKLSFDGLFCEMSQSVHGLVCLIYTKEISRERTETVPVVCNPSTGQSLPLPKLTTKRAKVISYLGYDPVDKQFKVLSMTWRYENAWECGEHQILTLGTRELSWRMIECRISHDVPRKRICINGVLYYPATDRSSGDCMIVSFDVRSESFKSIIVVEDVYGAARDGYLIDYNGKLGLYECDFNWFFDGSLELLVLEDAEKQVWSKHTYLFPPNLWKDIVGTTEVHFVGVTRTNEVVFWIERMMPSCLLYCNIERKTIVRVGLHGLEAGKNRKVYTCLDHVENVNLELLL
ncbi:PREDICTED: putative F-box protein At2g19630 [Camelina sativa]|uniref:F-box protein At2g19630 n=1 Tax=Camelina sativa TaxID=90675 RepID=A0ABM0T042_CAMSA|nr:PREDICTED: putative F-box protein At2g19630 [Camelina sativa]